MQTTDRSKNLKRIQLIRMLTFIALLVVGLISIISINNLLVSFVVAIIISYFISPIVSYIEGTGLGRMVAILIVYCFFTSLTGLMIWAVTPFFISQTTALRGQLPGYVDSTVNLFTQYELSFDSWMGGFFQINASEKLRGWLLDQSSHLLNDLPSILSSSFSVLFLSPILGFFILKDGRQFSRELLRMVPNNIFELTLSLQNQISEQIAQYIRARLLESIIVGAVCCMGFFIIGFPYAVLLGLFAALANLIPYIGPLFGAAPGIILAIINQSSPLAITLVCSVYIFAQVIDNFILIPLVVARIVNLHPVTVILSVLLGAQLLGILGMLISIPVASTLKVTFQSIYAHITDQGS